MASGARSQTLGDVFCICGGASLAGTSIDSAEEDSPQVYLINQGFPKWVDKIIKVLVSMS